MKYLIILALVGCAHLSQQDKSELAQLATQQEACVAAHRPDKAAIDDCRAKVRAYWNDKWNARLPMPDGWQ